MKKLTIVALVAIAAMMILSVAALADTTAPAHKTCPGMKADAKAGCMAGKDDKACCVHQKDMETALAALQKDLAMMEKGVPAADQAAFMKAHQANLKKFVDAHDACMKQCKAMADAKDAPKDAPKTDKK